MKLQEALREAFSEYSEIHAFVIGTYCGLTEWGGIDSEKMKNPDVQVEPHYAYFGYILGTLIRWAIIITVSCKFFFM